VNKPELSDLLKEVIEAGTLKASLDQWKVVNAIINCRTAALGGHMYKCSDCCKEHTRYNSCRNRHCPKCQGSQSARWLEARSKEMLPAPYFHLVFTMPHELNGIVLQNKEELLNILFRSVAKAITDVAKRNLGGQVGFFSVLHTWGQKLDFHPHIHCIVPGIVIEKDGTIKKTEENYLLPKNVLSPVFRAIFIRALVKAYRSNKLKFLGEQAELAIANKFFALIKTVKEKHWLVYAKKPFAGPQTVLKYLARYTHRVGISNSRILNSENGYTTFSYKDYANNHQVKKSTLTTSEFVRRFLLHVLPDQFVRIRHCGFLANGTRTKVIARIKNILPAEILTHSAPSCPPSCPHCGSVKIFKAFEIISNYTHGSHAHRTKLLPLVA
jgi:hypothetical protein